MLALSLADSEADSDADSDPTPAAYSCTLRVSPSYQCTASGTVPDVWKLIISPLYHTESLTLIHYTQSGST